MTASAISRPLSVPMSFMLSGLPVQLSDLVGSIACAGLGSVSIGSGLSASMGCGPSRRYSWSASWIVDVGGSVECSSHRSYMVDLDGFGNWRVCERSGFVAGVRGGGSYSVTVPRSGKFATRRGLSALREALTARVASWHRYSVGGFDSYKPTPW